MIDEDEFSPLFSPYKDYSSVAKPAVDLIAKIEPVDQNPIETNSVLRNKLVDGLSGLIFEYEKNLYDDNDVFKSISNKEFEDAIKTLGSAKSLFTELPDKIKILLHRRDVVHYCGISLSDMETCIEKSILESDSKLSV